jgi:hypothetical protein
MNTLFDNLESSQQALPLLGELEIIDKALSEGEAMPEQEHRGQEIVDLCNSALQMKAEIARLTRELQSEVAYRKECERAARDARRDLVNYTQLSSIYASIKAAAEADAQAPIDEDYRGVLGVLESIASDENACTCHVRGWHGEGHDTQCPIRIATDAHPLLKQNSRGDAT